jgi:hypothetical protein
MQAAGDAFAVGIRGSHPPCTARSAAAAAAVPQRDSLCDLLRPLRPLRFRGTRQTRNSECRSGDVACRLGRFDDVKRMEAKRRRDAEIGDVLIRNQNERHNNYQDYGYQDYGVMGFLREFQRGHSAPSQLPSS